jgi:predicted amidohydrolase
VQHLRQAPPVPLRKEHERYAAGTDRLTVEWKGWRICPLVCYDLRFPVFSRNRFDVESRGPARLRPAGLRRQLAVRAQLPVEDAAARRAIENLCFVAGGQPRRHRRQRPAYSGDSAIIDFLGHPLTEAPTRKWFDHAPAARR